ncbi:MAG TPA: MerR family transcriptional regulator [Terracidiphilus sp.]|jgi:DNA-binding transcriptional MerR regulator
MVATTKALRSGQLAKLAGVSSDTLRYYERLGILPVLPRTASGYRMYGPDSVERLKLAHQAIRLGFTLKELSEVLRARDRGEAPCRQVLALTEEKLNAIAQRIREFRKAERYLKKVIREWRGQLADAVPGKKALLLQSLTVGPGLQAKLPETLKRRKQT